MRIAVTGTQGQVSQALQVRAAGRTDLDVIAVGRPHLDLLQPDSVFAALQSAQPDAVISAAAYTQVDRAESEPDAAFAVNGAGAGAVAAAAHRLNIPVIQVSTDYVFDGAKPAPWLETDPTAPLGVYGASKLAGEIAVAEAAPNHAIIRIAWVYSPYGANFVKTMLRLAESRDRLTVVADQYGGPTSALDIAEGLLRIAQNLIAEPDNADLRGVFHMPPEGDAHWAGFAEAIFAGAAARGAPFAAVAPIPSSDYPTPARRPLNSRLDGRKLASAHGVRLPPWPESLDAVLTEILGAPPS